MPQASPVLSEQEKYLMAALWNVFCKECWPDSAFINSKNSIVWVSRNRILTTVRVVWGKKSWGTACKSASLLKVLEGVKLNWCVADTNLRTKATSCKAIFLILFLSNLEPILSISKEPHKQYYVRKHNEKE